MNENWSDNRTADDGLQKHAGQRVKLRGSGSGHGSAHGPSGFKTAAFQWVINNPFNLFFLTFLFLFFFIFWLLERDSRLSLPAIFGEPLPPWSAVCRWDLRPMMASFERSRPDLSRSGLYFSRIWAYGCESRFETRKKSIFFPSFCAGAEVPRSRG